MNFKSWYEIPQSGYHPSWPRWARYIGWFIRNPFPGITGGLLGLARPITITGIYPAGTWNPHGGFNKLHLVDAAGKSRYLLSYRGKYIEGYFGWKPSGSFGIALRKANATAVTGPHIG